MGKWPRNPSFSCRDREGAPSVTQIPASGLGPELPRAPFLALAQATNFEDVKLTVSLTNLIPQAFIKSIYCMLGFVPGAGELKRMGTLPRESEGQALVLPQSGRDRDTPQTADKQASPMCLQQWAKKHSSWAWDRGDGSARKGVCFVSGRPVF